MKRSKDDRMRQTAAARKACTKHGLSYLPVYGVWNQMMLRCFNTKHPRYKDWGGRGIKVCERWKDFTNFLSDMGAPLPGQQIDRIDNNGNYEPANCRWTSRKVNQRNTRRCRYLTHDGQTHCMEAWSEITGIPPLRIWWRWKRGWPIEEILRPGRRKSGRKRSINTFCVLLCLAFVCAGLLTGCATQLPRGGL